MMSILNKIETLSQNKNIQFVCFICLLFLMTVGMMDFYGTFNITADSVFHANRIDILMKALANGSYPTYMDHLSLNGYGYFVNAFYPDLLLLPFAYIGNYTSLTFAYTSLVFITTILCGLFTYMAINKVFISKYIAIMCSLLFTFTIYRLFDIYYRGAVGEYMAFTFIPLVFWGAYEIIKGDYKKWYILAIAMSLLIYTHNISTVIVSLTLCIYILIYWKEFYTNSKRLLYLLLAAGITVLLTASFVVPMVEQMLANSYYYSTHPATDIVYSLSTLSTILTGMFNNVPIAIEKEVEPRIGALLVSLLFLRLIIKEKSNKIKTVDISVLIGIIFIFTSWYYFPWNIFPFSMFTVIQHPSRLLLITSFLFAVAGSYYISVLIRGNLKRITSILILATVILTLMKLDGNVKEKAIGWHDPIPTTTIDHTATGDNSVFTVGGAEYLPSRIPSVNFLEERTAGIELIGDANKISNYSKNGNTIEFDIDLISSERLELPLMYYKGYKATLNDEVVQLYQSNSGLLELPLTKPGKVVVLYKGTFLQKVTGYISLISILVLTAYIVMRKRINNANKQKI